MDLRCLPLDPSNYKCHPLDETLNCRESRPDSSDPVILAMHYSRQTGVTAPASIEPLVPLCIKKKYL